jgi:putative ABC transport system ATP-binding protein
MTTTAAHTPPVLRLEGLTRTFPGPVPVHALREVDLTVARGEYLAVTGPSGSGKSTLLNLLGLLDRPTAGRFEFDGLEVAALTERERTALRARRIGFVFQSFHLLAHRTAAENVALGQLYRRIPAARRRHAAHDCLAQVGLAHRAEHLPATLSGGERQRVAIARALVNRPDLLLCDEPTGNLDSATAEVVLDLLDELNTGGQSVIVITHAPEVAARAHRQVRICDGRLTETRHRTGTDPGDNA